MVQNLRNLCRAGIMPCEDFTDELNGTYDPPEYFVDAKNGRYDKGEEFTDLPNGEYDEGEEFYDVSNGVYDAPEEFVDENGNRKWDKGEKYTDKNDNGIWDEGEEFVDLPDGEYNEGSVSAVLEKVIKEGNWGSPIDIDSSLVAEGWSSGRGIAFGYWPGPGGAASCTIRLNDDGSFHVVG